MKMFESEKTQDFQRMILFIGWIICQCWTFCSFKQICEHKRDLKKGNINNGFVRRNVDINQNFNF